jgi:hypothetical protein
VKPEFVWLGVSGVGILSLTAGTLFDGCREEADIWIVERPPLR